MTSSPSKAPPVPHISHASGYGFCVFDWIDATPPSGHLIISFSADKVPSSKLLGQDCINWFSVSFREAMSQGGEHISEPLRHHMLARDADPQLLAIKKTPHGADVTVQVYLPGLLGLGSANPESLSNLPNLRDFYAWQKETSRTHYLNSPDADGPMAVSFFRAGLPTYGIDWIGGGSSDASRAKREELNKKLAEWLKQPWCAAWLERVMPGVKKSFRGRPHSWITIRNLSTSSEQYADLLEHEKIHGSKKQSSKNNKHKP